MNPLIPVPPPTPVIASAPPTAPATSLGPTAVTAPPAKPLSEPPRAQPRPRRTVPKALWLVAGGAVIAAAAALAAWAEPAPPRAQIVSGRTSPKVTASGQQQRWWTNDITISLDRSLDKLGREGADAAAQAFGAWVSSGAKLPGLTFDSRPAAPILDEPDGDNRVYYAPIRFPGHENDLAITLAFTDEDTGEIVEADVIVNSRHRFALLPATSGGRTQDRGGEGRSGDDDRREDTANRRGAGDDDRREDTGNRRGSGDDDGRRNPSSGPGSGEATGACSDVYDVTSVLAHEAGHFFGLAEDTTDSKATMFFSTAPCDVGKRDLGSDDSAALSALYAAPPEGLERDAESGAVRGCSVASPGAGAPARGGFFLVLTGLALLGRLRRPSAVRQPLTAPTRAAR